MIVKILVSGKEFGVNVYENNFDGEVQVNDTFHCKAEADGRDTIFGTNDENITVVIPMDEIKKEIIAKVIKKDIINCPHKCGDCLDIEDDCAHGCHDCGYFDGGNCIHGGSDHCGCLGGECAHDCYEWDNGE